MRLLRSTAAAAAFIATAVTVPVAGAQAPSAGVDKGYLDFIGSYSGAPKVSNGYESVRTGPYRAKFGETSALASQATEFDVFCIDWLGEAGDGSTSSRMPWNVRILTFEEAVTAQTSVAISLRAKFASSAATAGGLTTDKLEKVAYISDLMTQGAKPQWNEMHVAMWNVMWKKGAAGPFALPGVTNGYSNTPWRVDDSGSDPNSAKYYADAANANFMNFDGSNFRIFVPVKEEAVCSRTERKRVYGYWKTVCVETTYNEVFDYDRQVLMGEVIPAEPGIVTPEPSTYALMGAGLLALGVVARRRRLA